MKTHQCPICGSKRTFLDIIPQGYQYICTQCGLCALRQFTPQEAAEAWNELVFKFPPIMRVHQGNNLKLDFNDDILTVIGKDTDRCKIYLEDYKGNTEIATPDDVDQWPWEIEQKGGRQ